MLVGIVTVYLFENEDFLWSKEFVLRGAIAWNNLDQTLYSATSLQTFVLSYKLLYT